MRAVYGVTFLAASVIVFTVVMLAFRRPNPPPWTQRWAMEPVVAIFFTATLAAGFSMLFSFLVEFKSQSFGLFEGGAIVAIAVISLLILRLLGPAKRLAEYERATNASEPANERAAE